MIIEGTVATTAVRPPSVLPDRESLTRVDLRFRNVGRGIKCGVGERSTRVVRRVITWTGAGV